MKSVLISIQPKWCELIASGKKTVEVRKTRPKLETPFKCYIYCTKSKKEFLQSRNNVWFYCEDKDFIGGHGAGLYKRLNSKVIGEFICDDINNTDIVHGDEEVGWYVNNMHAVKGSCLDEYDILNYCPKEATIYGWHISDLVIYDKPKELSEFYMFCGDNPKCDGCEAHYYSSTECGTEDYCCSIIDGYRPLKRPPQSWCYVEKGGGSDA